MRKRQIEEIIRKGSISYEYRDQQKGASALTAALCGVAICVLLIGASFIRGCSDKTQVVGCICEACGQVIASADHGQCDGTEVASCK